MSRGRSAHSKRGWVLSEYTVREDGSEEHPCSFASGPGPDKGRERHVVRGYVKKTVDTSQDEDEEGNTTIRETERFEVQIKTLSKDGEIKVLSGA